MKAREPHFKSELKPGLTQTLTPEQWKKVDAKRAKEAGLALQRTYNSMDDRIGPFGQGWTHAYDLRTEEENPTANQTDDALNYVDRADFFT